LDAKVLFEEHMGVIRTIEHNTMRGGTLGSNISPKKSKFNKCDFVGRMEANCFREKKLK